MPPPRRLQARKTRPTNTVRRDATDREQAAPQQQKETDGSSEEEVSENGETENRLNDTQPAVKQPPNKKMKVGDMYINDKPPAELPNEQMVGMVRNITNKYIFPYNKYEKSNNEVDDQLVCLVYKQLDWNKPAYKISRVKYWRAIEACVAKCIRDNRHYISFHLRKVIKGKMKSFVC